MTKKAILFGSIGTLVETSEIQRSSFNQAFMEAGLSWDWGQEEYRSLLGKSGGRQRIEVYAADRGDAVDAIALHKRKTEIFDASIVKQGLSLRSGVLDVLEYAQKNSIRLAFVTTTSKANVGAIFQAAGNQLPRKAFGFIGDASMVERSKPDPQIYSLALKAIALVPTECVAIEDTAVSMKAAISAGLTCVAFPGEYADRSAFGDVTLTDHLKPEELVS